MFGLAPDSPEAGPETIASMVSYLARPEAHFVTGSSIPMTSLPYSHFETRPDDPGQWRYTYGLNRGPEPIGSINGICWCIGKA